MRGKQDWMVKKKKKKKKKVWSYRFAMKKAVEGNDRDQKGDFNSPGQLKKPLKLSHKYGNSLVFSQISQSAFRVKWFLLL